LLDAAILTERKDNTTLKLTNHAAAWQDNEQNHEDNYSNN
jgi:hypothetical protein